MRSRTPGAFSQLSALASAFLALPVTSRYASDLVFPLATISANFSCLEFRRTGIALPLFTASACSPCGFAAAYDEDAALDCGGSCADLLTEDLDFVGILR